MLPTFKAVSGAPGLELASVDGGRRQACGYGSGPGCNYSEVSFKGASGFLLGGFGVLLG